MKIRSIVYFIVGSSCLSGQGMLGGYDFSNPTHYKKTDGFLSIRHWTSKEGSTFEGVLRKIEGDTVVVQRSSDKLNFDLSLSNLSELDVAYVERARENLTLEKIRYQEAEWLDQAERDAAFFAYVFLKRIDQKKLKQALQMVKMSEGGNPLVTLTQIELKRKGLYEPATERIKVASNIMHTKGTYNYRFNFLSLFGDKNVSEDVTVTLDENQFRIHNYR